MSDPIRLALLNPNSNTDTTALMVGIARNAVPAEIQIEPVTMQSSPPFIANETALAEASRLIVQAGVAVAENGVDGIIVAGFGDPGLFDLREVVGIPVTGIAEAGMAKAAEGGRRFSIITTTPELKSSIERTARRYGHFNRLRAVHITGGDAAVVMGDESLMSEALLQIAQLSAKNDGIEAILIGGGPLASSANRLARESKLPIIEPVYEGIQLALSRVLERD